MKCFKFFSLPVLFAWPPGLGIYQKEETEIILLPDETNFIKLEVSFTFVFYSCKP